MSNSISLYCQHLGFLKKKEDFQGIIPRKIIFLKIVYNYKSKENIYLIIITANKHKSNKRRNNNLIIIVVSHRHIMVDDFMSKSQRQ